MEIVHVAAECYPVAKVGGLADVVGALPKYQVKAGHYAKVIMPMHRTKFLYNNEWTVDFKGQTNMGNLFFEYTVIKEASGKLGYDLYEPPSQDGEPFCPPTLLHFLISELQDQLHPVSKSIILTAKYGSTPLSKE